MATVDINKEIRRAVDTGKVMFGASESEKAINSGTAKVFIAARNAPVHESEKLLAKAKIAKIHFLGFGGSNLDLGQVCGKPFNISFMAIKEPGKSTIMNAFRQKTAKDI